jgi:alanine-alpha-ketoisovalerate/valine-pyruvate aminotransferase
MKRMIQIAAFASIMLGSAAIVPVWAAPEDPARPAVPDAAVDKTLDKAIDKNFALPAGIEAKNLKADNGIRAAFGDATEAAVKKNGFDNVVDRLVDQDRKRVGEYKESRSDELNAVVEKIHKQWKDKYSHDFDVTRSERNKAFGGVAILEGEISNPDLLVGKWPIPQNPDMTSIPGTATVQDNAQTAASKQDIDQAKSKAFGGDVNLEKGRKVAIAQVPGALGLPEVRASLIHEKTGKWRFDIPNNITGQMLHDNLMKHLTAVADHPEQWPADQDAAYGMVGHHVLMALYNIDMPMKEAK